MNCATQRYGFFKDIYEGRELMAETINIAGKAMPEPVQLHVIATLINKHGTSVQQEEKHMTIQYLNAFLLALYLQQRTTKDFVRITVDIALPET